MNTGYGIAATLVLCLLVNGCAQQQVPQPYQREASETEQPQRLPERSEPVESQEPAAAVKGQTPEIDGSSLGAKARPLSAGFINDRISFYNDQLETLKQLDAETDIVSMDPERTRELFACSRDLQRILDGYQGFHERLFQGRTEAGDQAEYENIITLQRLDLTFLSGSCASLLAGDEDTGEESDSTPGSASTGRLELEIDSSFSAGAYDDVVRIWEQLPPAQQDSIDITSVLQYGDALMYLDRPEQSAEVYNRIIDRVELEGSRLPDSLTMRKQVADRYTAAGKFFEAEKHYELLMEQYRQLGATDMWARLQLSLLEQSMKGSPELTDYTQLLRSYLGYQAELDGFSTVWKAENFLQQYPYSPVSDNVDLIKADAVAQADTWFASFMDTADALVAEKEFQQAIDLLQSVAADKLNPEALARLNAKLDDLILAEAVDRETLKIEKMQELQRMLNEASALAEAGDYDNAIEVYGQLSGTEYEEKARAQITELALTSSRTERRKAADLFVRATKTDDLVDKKQLLADSRRVLKDILVKYPDVEIADKVRGNIRQVEKKMNEIDPLLLPQIEEQERKRQALMEAGDEEEIIEGFDVDPQPESTVDQPKKAVLPVYTPQSIQ